MAEKQPDAKQLAQQKQMQQKYMELQMLDQQMKNVQKQVEAIEQKASEVEEIQQSLDSLGATKKGTDMWVPIANGIFLKAHLAENSKLGVNVGSNIVASKDIPSTKAMLAEQAKDMRTFQADLVAEFEKMAERAAALQGELQHILGA
jgi:prefoldin alpha subunit